MQTSIVSRLIASCCTHANATRDVAIDRDLSTRLQISKGSSPPSLKLPGETAVRIRASRKGRTSRESRSSQDGGASIWIFAAISSNATAMYFAERKFDEGVPFSDCTVLHISCNARRMSPAEFGCVVPERRGCPYSGTEARADASSDVLGASVDEVVDPGR
mmetsp:Transcript_59542/g.69008  ORF Transcript_59542/g.69008 Transcript_59542/m.69008 type:complete len:161 (-) Transcript_59542:52-534(-)